MTPAASVDGQRAQANLPALAVALVLVTVTAGLGLSLADGAFADARREPAERAAAVGLSERLVSDASPLTTRGNVLNGSEVDRLSDDRFVALFPASEGRAVRVRLDGETLVERGDPAGGTTMRRVVLVERRQSVTVSRVPGDRIALPRRTPRATLGLTPPPATNLTTVRANGRVVLHDPSGLRGTFDVTLSRYETTHLAFEHAGPLPPNAVELTYYPARTTKAELVVTVDA
ncbi:DUF7263 family protein [Halomarina litorea]|uniref:DUF7263 family protein n=1 Tax=Halomarina litorea TaxID=2961595 RepID=UPI0020C3BC41|nr:hypothetical protein [Halomarina sp. BCD28]